MPQNDCNELKAELNELKTDFHNSQTAVVKAIRVVENLYTYDDLPMHHYNEIIEKLRHAEI